MIPINEDILTHLPTISSPVSCFIWLISFSCKNVVLSFTCRVSDGLNMSDLPSPPIPFLSERPLEDEHRGWDTHENVPRDRGDETPPDRPVEGSSDVPVTTTDDGNSN